MSNYVTFLYDQREYRAYFTITPRRKHYDYKVTAVIDLATDTPLPDTHPHYRLILLEAASEIAAFTADFELPATADEEDTEA